MGLIRKGRGRGGAIALAAAMEGARTNQAIGVSPAAIRVRAFKAPHPITDDVVIHELCHLIHPNHSKAFWQLVARHDPAYGEHRQWLRERGAALL